MPSDSALLMFSYLELCLFAIALLLLVFFQANKAGYIRDTWSALLFNLFLIALMVAMAADASSWWVEEKSFPGAYELSNVLTFFSFFTIPLPLMLWVMYTDCRLYQDRQGFRRRLPFYLIFFAINTVLCIVNINSGIYFYFDESNAYHRGPLLMLAYALGFLYIPWACILALWKRRDPTATEETRRLCRYHMLFIIPPAIGGVLQLAFYGISVGWIATTFSVMFYYINDQLYQLEKVRKLENENAQSKIAVMLSQIQPHFLYNSLVVIKQLCDIDPPRAKEAVVEFSHYLRSNLDSLKLETCIPFVKELDHVRNYLALEQKRFEDRVRVRYEIDCTDFQIPPLTIQPLVENAVRYGLMGREEGGTVTIATQTLDSCILITIKDDGIGFDPQGEQDDGRSHVGIENISRRLELMCNGELTIESIRGVGTSVSVLIPDKSEQT